MAVLLVTYDLNNKDGQDYEKLLDVIRRYDYVELCESSYAVDTDKANEFWKELSETLDKGTTLFVFSLTSSLWIEWKKTATGHWLEDHLGKKSKEH